jgi:Protein of unknown function (DUF3533)
LIIQDFFFLGTINGLYEQFKIYTRIIPERIIMFRYGISIGFAMFGTMLISGVFWAFKASWNVSAVQYAQTWLILWLFAHANFLSLDVFTIWIPPQYVSMALITWVVINVTSIIYPFELSSPFYRWSYALPAHAAYDALTDNWSHGCSPHLSYALPVLFAYELSGLFLSGLGVYKRCHYAMVREGVLESAALLQPEKSSPERETSRRTGGVGELPEKLSGDDNVEEASHLKIQEKNHRQELGENLEHAETTSQKKASQERAGVNFGPSFRLFGTDDQ